MKIDVAKLRPNPYRNAKHYPISREKVDALKRSIKDTTFWDNLLARPAPDGDGYELAYGLHRRTALDELKIATVDIPVRDLSNTRMAQIMAHENMEEFNHNASVEQETLRAIIDAYGKGEIDLPKPKDGQGGGSVRFAPKFSAREENFGKYPYTVATLCKFLGWKTYKVEAALGALELIEAKIAEPSTFEGLSSRQAQAVTDQAKRILNDKKQPEADPHKAAGIVARGLAAGMRRSTDKSTEADKKKKQEPAEVTIHTAKRKADEFLGRDVRKKMGGDKRKHQPLIDEYAMELARKLGTTFDGFDVKIREIIKCREDLSDDAHKTLVGALTRMIDDTSKLLAKLDPEAVSRTINGIRLGQPHLGISAE